MTPAAPPGGAAAGLLVGNLDFEVELARQVRPQQPPPDLAPSVRRWIAAASTLLRALARSGDRLWTPAPVSPARLPPVPGLPEVTLCSGSLGEHAGPVLPWGETAATAALRRPAPQRRETWWEALWSLAPSPEAALRCNDRRFAAALARELGIGLPAAGVATSMDELAALAPAAAAAGLDGTWVAKAPLSASGRHRLRVRGESIEALERTRLERMLRHYGALMVEPWVERLADAGCCGIVAGPGDVDLLGVHGLEIEPSGQFRGVAIGDLASGLEPGEVAAVQEVAGAAGERLADNGYRGAFGVDAYAWRDRDGRRRLQPLSEINARLSFGLVARVLAERVVPDVRAVTLRLGTGEVPPRSVPLLLAGDEDRACAYLAVQSDAAGNFSA